MKLNADYELSKEKPQLSNFYAYDDVVHRTCSTTTMHVTNHRHNEEQQRSGHDSTCHLSLIHI